MLTAAGDLGHYAARHDGMEGEPPRRARAVTSTSTPSAMAWARVYAKITGPICPVSSASYSSVYPAALRASHVWASR
jgi:hypothetical protein